MDLLETYSSIVIAGEGFTPSLFKAEKHVDELGEIDDKSQVVPGMLSQHFFTKTGYKVLITPDRIDFGFNGSEILPDILNRLIMDVAQKSQQLEVGKYIGVGFNLHTIISSDVLGATGKEYLRQHFVADTDIEARLQTDELIANTAKLIYDVDGIRYNFNIEPNFASDMLHLHVKLNGHQDIDGTTSLDDALSKLTDVKKYYMSFHDKFFGAK